MELMGGRRREGGEEEEEEAEEEAKGRERDGVGNTLVPEAETLEDHEISCTTRSINNILHGLLSS